MFSKSGSRFLIFLFVVLFLAYTQLGNFIKSGIVKFSSPILGISVTVQDVDISLFFGKATVEKLALGNPEGFSSPNVLKIEKLVLDYNIRSLLFNPTITFHQILIDGLEINFDQGISGNNLSTLHDQWSKRRFSNEESKVGRDLVIKELIVENIKVTGQMAGLKVTKDLPEIRLKNLGSKSSPTKVRKVSLTILEKLLDSFAEVLTKDPIFQNLPNIPKVLQRASEKAGQGLEEVGRELIKIID